MIFYLVRAEHALMEYVSSWGCSPGSRMRFLFYDELVHLRALSPGSYLFADLETLSPAQLRLAVHVWQQLSRAGDGVRLLNDPARVLRRYDLLQTFYDRGINRYRAVRASESVASLRFPVFIKCEYDHGHALPILLDDWNQLRKALRYLNLRGHSPKELLVVEFCDTSDSSSVFRKYSAFFVGDAILPRHVIFTHDWNAKRPDLMNEDYAREQEEYLEGNPHKEWLRGIFQLACIDFGRIDYSMLGDQPQVWEINTHPTIHKLAERLTAAFEVIDCGSVSDQAVPLDLPSALIRRIKLDIYKRRSRALFSGGLNRLLMAKVTRRLVRGIRAFRPNPYYRTDKSPLLAQGKNAVLGSAARFDLHRER